MQQIKMYDLQKSIKGKVITQSANLSIDKGEVCALIGPNGAGKTTLIKCLLGLTYPDQGRIEIDQKMLSYANSSELLLKVGAVLQYPISISTLTIDQLFTEHFQYLNLEKTKSWNDILQKVDLNVAPYMQIGKMSLGMKQRLLLAMALSHNPNVLILDEPFNGLDIDGIILIKHIIKKLRNDNISILITSHSLSDLEDLATSVVFMLNGITCAKKDVKVVMKEYKGGLREYYQHLKKRG